MASRLSEDPATSVALLEAGGKDDNWVVTTPGAHDPDDLRQGQQLGVRYGAAGRPQWKDRLSAARQGTRRLVRDQRDGLYPRPPQRLRPVGLARQQRLVLCRRAALFQALGGQFRTRRRVSRQGRPAPRHRTAIRQSGAADLSAGRARGAVQDPRGFQWRGAGRPRHLPGHPEERRALERGARLYSSASGNAGEFARRDRRAGDPHPVRGQARRRRRIPAGQGDEADPRPPRSDPVLRRVPDPATADAVRRRRWCRAGQARHRHHASFAGGRTEPAGSSGFRVRLCLRRALFRRPVVRRHRADLQGDRAIPARAARTDDLEHRRMRRLPQDAARPRRARHPAAFLHGDGERSRPQAALGHRLLLSRLPAAARKPRQRLAAERRSAAGAGDRSELSRRGRRP